MAQRRNKNYRYFLLYYKKSNAAVCKRRFDSDLLYLTAILSKNRHNYNIKKYDEK